jgi:hypothetical protein
VPRQALHRRATLMTDHEHEHERRTARARRG